MNVQESFLKCLYIYITDEYKNTESKTLQTRFKVYEHELWNWPLQLISYWYSFRGARMQEQPAPFTLPEQLHWHSFPANGATCRSVRGPVRTVSEGNADRAGGVMGGWWCRASVTGTGIEALSFLPVLLNAMGRRTEPATCAGQGTQHMSGDPFSVIWVSGAQVNSFLTFEQKHKSQKKRNYPCWT